MPSPLAYLLYLEAWGALRRTGVFFATFFLSSLTTYVAMVLTPLYALRLTQSLPLISLLTTAYYLAFTLFLPLYGKLSDKLRGYAWFTALGAALTGLLCIATPATSRFEELVALRTAQGVAWALVAPMGAAMASISTIEAFRGRAVSIYNLSVSSGYLAGSILSGAVSEALDIERAFIIGGTSSLIATGLAMKLRGEVRLGGRAEARSRLREARVVYVGFFLRNAGATGVWALLPIYLASLGASELWIGILYAVNMVSQTALMRHVGRLTDKIGRKPVFVLGLFASSAVFLIYGLSTHYLWILPAHVLLGLAWCSLITASTAYVGDRAPLEAQGAAMSLLFTTTGLAWIAGSGLAAALVDFVGLRNYMLIAALLSAVGGAYAVWFMEPRLRARPKTSCRGGSRR
ncbi:MAG: MFS transporter [Candidatus Nezhaarchaeota archaeon]|nr:MFS transporter [Candidatus Nezhaarchaeota archaeon]